MGAIEVFRTFLGLGCTAFGGPVAHVALFRETFVRRRAWIDEHRFADLLALAQALPGPSSSQLGFAIGVHRAGFAGGAAAWLGFTLPGAALMTAAALGWRMVSSDLGVGCLRGLKAAAVGVVAHALWSMGRSLTPDAARRALALAAATLALAWDGAAMQLSVIGFGAMSGLLALQVADDSKVVSSPERVGRRTAMVALMVAACAVMLPWRPWSAFARSGALTFGGGHVVLPLLESRLVHADGLDASTFLAGYGLAQALPGPLFTFAAFAGAASPGSLAPVLAAMIALVAIFLPGIALMLASMPTLPALRGSMRARRALSGVHAAVVGLLLAALLGPVRQAGLVNVPTCGIAVATIAMLGCTRWPVSALVAMAAGAGALVAGGAN